MDKRQKILEISKKLGLSHIGSCLSVLPILEEIYSIKKPGDKVLLCAAHSHLAHLMFIDPDNAEGLTEKYGIHCDRKAGCDASGGSLGHAGGMAIGMAIANPSIDVYLVDTDGSLQEGSCWEVLRIIYDLEWDLMNHIKIYVNCNGYTATSTINKELLTRRLQVFYPDINIRYTDNSKEFNGIQGHYKKL